MLYPPAARRRKDELQFWFIIGAAVLSFVVQTTVVASMAFG